MLGAYSSVDGMLPRAGLICEGGTETPIRRVIFEDGYVGDLAWWSQNIALTDTDTDLTAPDRLLASIGMFVEAMRIRHGDEFSKIGVGDGS